MAPRRLATGKTAQTTPTPQYAFADSGVAARRGTQYEAEQRYDRSGVSGSREMDKTLHPEIYKEGNFVDLTPGDDVKDNHMVLMSMNFFVGIQSIGIIMKKHRTKPNRQNAIGA
jgi:hypothetical protein